MTDLPPAYTEVWEAPRPSASITFRVVWVLVQGLALASGLTGFLVILSVAIGAVRLAVGGG